MMSIRIMYSSSSLSQIKSKGVRKKQSLKLSHLLFEFSLDTIDVDTLTDLEYILCKRRINDENLPCSRHESTSKQSRDDEYDTDVKHYQVGRVARKEAWQYFLLEQNEAKSATSYEYLVLKQINLILGCGVRTEHLI